MIFGVEGYTQEESGLLAPRYPMWDLATRPFALMGSPGGDKFPLWDAGFEIGRRPFDFFADPVRCGVLAGSEEIGGVLATMRQGEVKLRRKTLGAAGFCCAAEEVVSATVSTAKVAAVRAVTSGAVLVSTTRASCFRRSNWFSGLN